MERRRFGPTAVEVPIIRQVTWHIAKADRAAAVAALRRGLDLGMTHVDTAEYYGEAENIVGEAIAGRRTDVFLISKVVTGTRVAGRHHHRLRAFALAPEKETVTGFDHLYRDGKIRPLRRGTSI